MSVCLLLAALDPILESLFVLLGSFEFDLAYVFGVEACIDDFLVYLALLRFHLLVQIHSSLWSQEGAFGKLLEQGALVLLIISLFQRLHPLLTSVSLLELVFVMLFEERLVNVLIKLG